MFEVKHTIGSGGFGFVCKASGADGRDYAIKSIPKVKNQSKNIAREVEAGLILTHQNIGNYITQYQDETNNYLAFEYIEGKFFIEFSDYDLTQLVGCDLFTFMDQRDLKGISEMSARYIMKQLFSAVKYSHDNGVVHLDIKLENVMIQPSNGTVKLIDFGLCDFIKEDGSELFARFDGSDDYLAAELIRNTNQPYSGTKVDVWCLGVVLFGLLSGSFPFNSYQRRVAMKGGRSHPGLTFTFKCSKKLKDLLTRMMDPNPKQRITMSEILKHPWVKQKAKWDM